MYHPDVGLMSYLSYDEMYGNEIIGEGENANGYAYGGIHLVPGLHNSALYTNGYTQWVDFGDHSDSCAGYPDFCPDGFTNMFWLQLGRKSPTGEFMYIFTSGPPMYPGFAMYHDGRYVEIQVKTLTIILL